MTIHEIQKLSDEQFMIMTAELCGWTQIAIHPWHDQLPGDPCRADTTLVLKGIRPNSKWVNLKGEPAQVGLQVVPFYPISLDAMAQALSILTKNQKECFAACLEESCEKCSEPDSYIGYMEYPPDAIFNTFIHRSARDLNTAFLAVLLP